MATRVGGAVSRPTCHLRDAKEEPLQGAPHQREQHLNRILNYECMILSQDVRCLRDLALSVEARTSRVLKRISIEMGPKQDTTSER